MSVAPTPPRAPPISAWLEAAREVLIELERDVGQFVLDAADGVEGAAKRLAGLRSTIAAAQRDVGELEQAHALAVKLDLQANAGAAATMRAEQFAIMKMRAANRLDAVRELMAAIGAAADAYARFKTETQAMVTALPTGTRLPTVALGNGNGGSWLGDLKTLIAAEAWRVAAPDGNGSRAHLPFAQNPDITCDVPSSMPSGSEMMALVQSGVLRDIEIQMERLNEESLALIEVAA